MSVDHDSLLFQETPTARRILAIDDEIAALDRIRPKARYLWYGIPLLVTILLLAVTLASAGTRASEALLRVILLVAIPGVVFGVQLTRNSFRRHQLERELDELIADRPTGDRRRIEEGETGSDR